jgi:hypothetical protein
MSRTGMLRNNITVLQCYNQSQRQLKHSNFIKGTDRTILIQGRVSFKLEGTEFRNSSSSVQITAGNIGGYRYLRRMGRVSV